MNVPGNCAAEPAIGEGAPKRCWPLRALADGRPPVVTSGFREVGRRDHQGCDLLYVYRIKDPWLKPGDGGAVIRRGIRRWWVPPGTQAIACEDGEIVRAGQIKTGWRLWIHHPDSGVTTGYFHLRSLNKATGTIRMGEALGFVGDNPAMFDPIHLHFETIWGRRMPDPLPRFNPVEYLAGATVLPYLA